MKVLIFGLPGSGKTTLAKPFAKLIGGVHINADEVRKTYDDWDFSEEGRKRQAQRRSTCWPHECPPCNRSSLNHSAPPTGGVSTLGGSAAF